jgi:hypothetical protein
VSGRIAALVRAILPLAAALACAGATPAAPPADTAELGKPFTLAPGESATLGSGKVAVRLVAVSEDSRCPKNEQCVWAGNARVELEVRVGGGEARPVTLETNRGASDTEVGDFTLALVDVAPAPISGRTISPQDYRVTLTLGHGAASGPRSDAPVR